MIAPINSTGYGVVSFNLLREFALQGNVSLWPIGPIEQSGEILGLKGLIDDCIRNCTLFDKDAPSLRVWHQFDMAQSVGQGPRLGYTFFEVDRLRPNEVHHLNSLDRLYLPSLFYKGVAEDSGVTVPISLAYPGVDTNIFDKSMKVHREDLAKMNVPITNDDTVFFHSGKMEIRKATNLIPELFKRAFPTETDVKLIAHIYNPCLSPKENDKWFDLYNGDSRIFSPRGRLSSQRDLAKLMAIADCGVFPSRAEGWNLELAEMLVMEKHVIATAYSSHLEFANDKNAMLVEITETEPAYDGKWFMGEAKWAKLGEAQLDAIVQYMRKVYTAKKSGNLPPNKNDVADKFTWKNTANMILERANG